MAELAARVQDGGAVAFQPQFTVGPAEAEALRRPGSTIVVAVLGGRVLGAAVLPPVAPPDRAAFHGQR